MGETRDVVAGGTDDRGHPNGDVDAVGLHAVRKVFGRRAGRVEALGGVTIGFERGTFTAVMGPSGSGKSTLLNTAAGLVRPTSGSVVLDGLELTDMNETALTKLRRERIGFVFQAFNLMPSLTVVQNVVLPLRLAGRRPERGLVDDVIQRTGLSERLRSRPAELSGGQRQRVAIARALVMRPAVILADEPTGALDMFTARGILQLLRESVRTLEQTVIMVSHDPTAASFADRVVFLADGLIGDEMRSPAPDAIAERMIRLGAWSEASGLPGRPERGEPV